MRNRFTVFQVKKYTADRKSEWNAFLDEAKNTTFLFDRDYMDYHSDRFVDHSLMIYDEEELAGLMPMNLTTDGAAISHQGLTYGGLVVGRTASLPDVLAALAACLHFLHMQGIPRLLYKRIPSYYNTIPDDDVAYGLFLLNAHLCRVDSALVIKQTDRLGFRKGRKSEVSKARRFGVQVVRDSGFAPFWEQVLSPRLQQRFGVQPVHTLEEITLLASRFPECIKQFSAYHENQIVAGITIYETPTVAHAQYIAVTEAGEKIGALDFLIGSMIEEHYRHKLYFDLGNCCENEGRKLNLGLMDWKEGFGGRCQTQEFYDITTGNHAHLESILNPEKIPALVPDPNEVHRPT